MKTATKTIISVLAILLLVVILGEFGARAYLSNRIKEEAPVASEEIDVSFGTVPILFGFVSGALNQVDAQSPQLTVEADGIHLRGEQEGLLDHISITTDVQDDELLRIFQQEIRNDLPERLPDLLGDNLTVTDINSVQGENIHVEFVHGASTLALTPVIKDGSVSFEAPSSTLFGMPLPEEANRDIAHALTKTIKEAAGANSLTLRNLDVLDGGVRVTVSGENINVADLQQP